MFKNKKAIICDLDGTLIPSIEMWDDVDRKLIRSFEKEPSSKIGLERSRFLSENVTGDIYDKYGSFLLKRYGIKGLNGKEISQRRNDISMSYLREDMVYNYGVAEFLKLAKERGFLLALATSSSRWVLDIYNNENANMYSKFKLYDMFDSVITKDEVKSKKPNSEVYLSSVEALDVDKRRVIAIEDELVGVIAANNANIDVINIYESHSDHDREEIDRLSTYQVKDFCELIKKL